MWEAISAVAASTSVIVAMAVLLVSLYKTKPRISVRWNLDYKFLSIEFINTGERIAERVQVVFNNLDNLRKGSNKDILLPLTDERHVFTVLPGEGYILPLVYSVTAGPLMGDENVEKVLKINGEWNYRSWPLKGYKSDSDEWAYLRWDDYYKVLLPPEPAEDKLVKSIDKLTKAIEGRK